jgi:hypothetical protein
MGNRHHAPVTGEHIRIRALNIDIRAVVSPRYATLDNDGLLGAVEPILHGLNAKATALPQLRPPQNWHNII